MIRHSNRCSMRAKTSHDSQFLDGEPARQRDVKPVSRLHVSQQHRIALQFFDHRVRPRRREGKLRKVPRPLENPQKKISAIPFLSFASQNALL